MRNNSLIFLLLIIPFISQCGNVADPESSQTNGESVKGITFSPDISSGSTENNLIYMVRNEGLNNNNEITIDVKAKGMVREDILGMAFELDFDHTALTYEGKDYGDLFMENKAYVIVSSEEGSQDKLLVAIAIKDKANRISPDGVIISLRFKVNSKGSILLSFNNNEIRDLSNQKISGVVWYGGRINVQ